jgi:hypothetical protein
MKQLLQYMRNGRTLVEEVPVPSALPGTALVCTHASLVSAGTERMVVEFARQSLGKAAAGPISRPGQGSPGAHRCAAAFSRWIASCRYSSAGTIVEL